MDNLVTESAIHRILWCTGKDSNLRTSLGGTDLQSVGFNHSPTCANFPGRCGRCAPSNRPHCRASGKRSRQPADKVTIYFRNTGKPRLAQETPRRSHGSLHTGKDRNGVRLEKPVAPLPPPAEFVSLFIVSWSWRRDLNPRPPDYKSGALPTELRQQTPGKTRRRANLSL